MIRGLDKIRAAVAVGLLSIPYVLLFAAGSVWLFQNHLLLGWAGLSLACTAAGWYLLRGVAFGPASQGAARRVMAAAGHGGLAASRATGRGG